MAQFLSGFPWHSASRLAPQTVRLLLVIASGRSNPGSRITRGSPASSPWQLGYVIPEFASGTRRPGPPRDDVGHSSQRKLLRDRGIRLRRCPIMPHNAISARKGDIRCCFNELSRWFCMRLFAFRSAHPSGTGPSALIANSNYVFAPLANPSHDASDIARALSGNRICRRDHIGCEQERNARKLSRILSSTLANARELDSSITLAMGSNFWRELSYSARRQIRQRS